MTDLMKDPMWSVTVSLTTGTIAPTREAAIQMIVDSLGTDIVIGEWGNAYPFDLNEITAEEIEED